MELWGTTLTSPTVYISFSTLYATRECGGLTGSPISNYIMDLQSSDISTQCPNDPSGVIGFGSGSQMNFANLNTPVPWSAYSCMQKCILSPCSTIWDDYIPFLAIPSAVFDLQPAWKYCAVGPYANLLTDPPYALTPYAAAAAPTPSSMPMPTTAAPISPVMATLPIQTQSPQDPKTLSATAHTSSVDLVDPSNPGVPSNPGAPDPSQVEPIQPARASLDPSASIGEPKAQDPPRGSAVQPKEPATTPAASTSSINIGQIIGGARATTQSIAGGGQRASKEPAEPDKPLPINGDGSQESSDPAHRGDLPSPARQGIDPRPTHQGAGSQQTRSGAAVVFTLGSQTYTASGGSLDLGSKILTVGATAATVSGKLVSLASEGAVIDGSTIAYSTPAATVAGEKNDNNEAVFTAGAKAFTAYRVAGSNGAVMVGGVTLAAGAESTLDSGVTVSNAASGLVVDGSSLISFGLPSIAASQEAVFTIGSGVFTALRDPSHANMVNIDGNEMSVGGLPVTIDGKAIGVGRDGLVIGTSTVRFDIAGSQSISLPSLLGATIQAEFTGTDGAVHTAFQVRGASGSTISIDGHTLRVGGPAITLDGRVISDAPNGIVIDGRMTVPFTQAADIVAEATFTIGSSTLTAVEDGSDAIVINGSTLSIGGPAVVIDGQAVSDGPDGLVVGDPTTVPLFTTETAGAHAGSATSTPVRATTSDAESVNFKKHSRHFGISQYLVLVAGSLLVLVILVV